jgi:hypothetical protein
MIGMAYQDAAREYVAVGMVPLPLGGEDGKRPLVSHPGKFGRHAALQIAPKFPEANLGIWCGHFNRLTVVDIDSPKESELQYALDTFGPSPIIVRTASRKHHVWYRYGGERRRIRPIKGHEIDLLGEGGLVVAPPSVRPSGGKYEFIQGSLDDLAELRPISREALQLLQTTKGKSVAAGVPAAFEGVRNMSLFDFARSIAQEATSLDDLLAKLRRANSENKPPLPDAEVQRTAGSVWRYKMNNTLMVPGSESSIMLPSASIARFLDEGDIDGIALMALFRRVHGGQPGKEFAASPAAMERDRCIGSWDKRRYRNGIRKLCELGELVQITKGGKGKRDPALYRLGQPKKGGQFAPQY